MTEMTLLQFPCEFPVKIFGHNTPDFEPTVLDIVRRHFPLCEKDACRTRSSVNGTYIAMTVLLVAESQQQLDCLYQDLTLCEIVTMSL